MQMITTDIYINALIKVYTSVSTRTFQDLFN
jgi:hypothetical protein